MTDPRLDPLAAAESIAGSYLRYLRTSFWLSDEELRRHFEAALTESIDLTRGPFLQAAPPYEPGRSINDLISEGVLHEHLRKLDPGAIPPDRSLYVHQEEAIRKLIGGRNLVVATGTGSGKTECYLLPILDSLVRSAAEAPLTPGVRALLLYPMNALANDQLKRIRELLAPFPSITFGRYVGETPDRLDRALVTYQQRFGFDPLPNELIAREQMQDTAPHILLTNYAMLEYLLLRPSDSAIFDGPTGEHWHHIVLDEVHVYDGARGAELGMLLRRVRDRVHRSQRGRLRCVGTSATLGKGRDDMPRLIRFASAIFDEEFEWLVDDPARQDVVEPRRLPLAQATTHSLSAETLARIHSDWRAGADIDQLRTLAPPGGDAEDSDSWLDAILRGEEHVVRLQELLERGATDIRHAAGEVLGPLAKEKDLTALVDLCVAARHDHSSTPLLPARYHFLLRALEGAFVCVSPSHPLDAARVSLARREKCEDCVTPRMFEVGVCRKCGAPYLVGDLSAGSFEQATLTAGRLDFLLVHSVGGSADDEDEAALEGEANARTESSTLCVDCGKVTEGVSTSRCSCGGATIPVTQAIPADEGRDLRKCVACSGRSNTSIVYRFLTGADAPVAVIATSLYQALPLSPEPEQQAQVGGGRKLLSFADSRQDAAFFAPYFERTYARAVERRLIWGVLSSSDEEMRLEDLVTPLRRAAEDALVLDPDDGATTNKSRVRHWLMREVLSVDRRQSLEGVGLAEVTVALPRTLSAPPALTDLGLDPQEAIDLVRVLVDSLRTAAAVWLPDGIDITDPIFSPRNVVTQVRQVGSDYGILSWLPTSGRNRRVDYLEKVFARRAIDSDVRAVLRQMWEDWLTAPGGPWTRILAKDNKPAAGTVFAIEAERVAFLPVRDDHTPFRCNICQQVWWRSVSAVCPAYQCPGSLEVAETGGDGHYRRLYTDLSPIGIKVEEHTGQLEARYAAELQEEFVTGKVNVLSCSTTFELGVDVGEVQGILMRNVPPSAANYVQRAGRAGRRAGAAALVVTYAQRRNHDLWFFRDPQTLIDGVVEPPLVNIDNAHIARRHLHAVALAAWERLHVDHGGTQHRTVDDFFLPSDDSAFDSFAAWLRSHPADLGAAVERVVPAALADELGVKNWGWAEALLDAGQDQAAGWLDRAAREVRTDVAELDAAYKAAKEADKLKLATAIAAVRNTLTSRRLIDFLAQRGVLPKYGFPVDVVTLDVATQGDRDSGRVELDRDLQLAITDFAPGNKVVANKVLWECVGLRTMPGRALVRKRWAVCNRCGQFWSRLLELDDDDACPTCENKLRRAGGVFVIPSFGFVGRRCDEKPSDARPPKRGFSERYFDEYEGLAPNPRDVALPSGASVEVRYSRQARITVVNRGGRKGFHYCASCGYISEPATGKTRAKGTTAPGHERPRLGGGTCTATLTFAQLGHQYLTDAVELRFESGVLRLGEEASVLQAILGATTGVGISTDDVDGDLSPYSAEPAMSLVLFDNVPGGAGHASHLADNLPRLLDAAHRLVAACECGEDSSCYACLRSYRNQRYHDTLRRGDAKRALELLIG